MFTLEEGAQLGFMLRVVAAVVVAVLITLVCSEAVHWLHAHHRTILRHHL